MNEMKSIDQKEIAATGHLQQHPLLLCRSTRFRPDGTLSNSFRSIEHVLMSSSCVTNRHLRRLTYNGVKQEAWAERFLNLLAVDKRCANLACHKSKSLKKELVEGVSIIERVEHLLLKLCQENTEIDSATGEGLLLLDMCSGKGIAATMLAVRFPKAKVVGIDIRPPSPTEQHLEDGFLPNLIRRTGNVYDDELLHEIVTCLIPANGTCIVLGTHLCGDLSRVAVDLFDRYPEKITAAVIAPCCLQRQKAPTGSKSFSGKDWGYDTRKAAQELGIDPFSLWIERLRSRTSAPNFQKKIVFDHDMLTNKNAYLLICRAGIDEDGN